MVNGVSTTRFFSASRRRWGAEAARLGGRPQSMRKPPPSGRTERARGGAKRDSTAAATLSFGAAARCAAKARPRAATQARRRDAKRVAAVFIDDAPKRRVPQAATLPCGRPCRSAGGHKANTIEVTGVRQSRRSLEARLRASSAACAGFSPSFSRRCVSLAAASARDACGLPRSHRCAWARQSDDMQFPFPALDSSRDGGASDRCNHCHETVRRCMRASRGD